MIWLIGIGGSFGAAARYLLGNFINRKKKLSPFPLGTWLINITGSFLLGVLANLHLSNEISDGVWFFVGIGFCGAYTTFSTFGYETITLLQSNKKVLAGIYVLSSVFVSILTAAIGFLI
ncbi:fluoride efflux transporter CrcB [Bacillus sp. EB106-08-02-XG196]|uniref:fluoride efflux transporter CrcB n=1 Tax=Bacillus sp. EB106-08-02-XG196 TaxID=2737049 RepID=UPI0015C414A7|nr:fluoride efflux transporter CrcB [Bacillus sp. EB106-08-02-XG196]NWQ42638.1 fluoride efflux transporter CrcB [Bacillus sp. EB106-08-02-XG196]